MHIIVSGRFMRVENIKGTPNTIMYMNVLRTFAAEILKTLKIIQPRLSLTLECVSDPKFNLNPKTDDQYINKETKACNVRTFLKVIVKCYCSITNEMEYFVPFCSESKILLE